MPKTTRLLAVLTVAGGAMVGALAASAAPMTALGTLPQATGSASVVVPAYWVCWWDYGYQYCKWCWWSYGERHCGKKHRKKHRKHRYYY